MPGIDTAKERLIVAEDVKKILIHWFCALQEREDFFDGYKVNGRAWRAELRRAEAPFGVITCDGFNALRVKLQKAMHLEPGDILSLALFASVVIHARKHQACSLNGKEPLSFPAQLGEELGGRPALSALRFDRLQKVREPHELCLQLIRAVKLRGNSGVNIVSLADCIMLWMREHQARKEYEEYLQDPFSRSNVRWVNEYISVNN